jgi:predicted transcriptional regulator
MAPRKRKALPVLHELETEVMEELWRLNGGTVRAVMEAVNERVSKPRAYTTYMTIMARLHKKGVLKRRRVGKADFYSPLMSRDYYREARARADVKALVDDYGDLALAHFARQMNTLDPKRREKLRRLARRDP